MNNSKYDKIAKHEKQEFPEEKLTYLIEENAEMKQELNHNLDKIHSL